MPKPPPIMDSQATGISNKERIFLGCRHKTCCQATRVIVGGQDIWRISHALELAPTDFTQYCPAPPDAVDGFRLNPAGPCYQIVLAKRGTIGPAGAPCIFSWRANDGHGGCGLGALRPRACLNFPALLLDGMVAVDGGVCTCHHWSILDLGDEEGAGLERQLAEVAEYSRVVTTWNSALTGPRTYPHFCEFVLDYYARQIVLLR